MNEVSTHSIPAIEPMSLPPSYLTELQSSDSSSSNLLSDLPIYTRRPPPQSPQLPKEFTAELNRKGKSWATLTVLADPVVSAGLPTILEGSDITGSVKLILDSKEAIQSVVVRVKGEIIAGASIGEQYTFLDLSTTLWSQEMGNPRNPSTMPGEAKYNDKLYGNYLWPFSISLPKEVILPVGPKGSPQAFRLPQTFVERHVRASIHYNMTLRLVKNKLRTDNRIQMSFRFITITKPDPPSPLRQLAYQENSPLWGPDVDPDGWYSSESVRIQGRIFGARPVDANCTLALATPLCYTKGSVIPCSITIETEDLQTLDLLSSSKAIVLRLRRSIRYHKHAAVGWKDGIDHSQLATWWSASEGATCISSAKRQISGELHIPINTTPSLSIGHFRIEYSVVLFPFDAAAFESVDVNPLLIIPVQIASTYSVGPRPQSYTPPGYEAHHAPASVSYSFVQSTYFL